MKPIFLFLLIFASVFGSELNDSASVFGSEFNSYVDISRPNTIWDENGEPLVRVEFINFGNYPEYKYLSPTETDKVNEMKRKIVIRGFFGFSFARIQIDDVIVNEIHYGPYAIEAIHKFALPKCAN